MTDEETDRPLVDPDEDHVFAMRDQVLPEFDDDPTTWAWPTERTGPVGLQSQPTP